MLESIAKISNVSQYNSDGLKYWDYSKMNSNSLKYNPYTIKNPPFETIQFSAFSILIKMRNFLGYKVMSPLESD